MADITEIVEYYVNLLIIQYNDKPKARATISALVESALASGLAFDVREGFDLETAVGAQLDILGKYIGVDRFYNSSDIEGLFYGFTNVAGDLVDGVTGFAITANWLTQAGEYLTEADLIGNGITLNDENYRQLLKLKILINNSNFSNKEINENLFKFFGTDLYMVDTYHMALDYFANPALSVLVQAVLAKDLLPAPMGVRVNNVIEDILYFGYSDTTGYQPANVTGYALSTDWAAKAGTFLTEDNIIT